MRICFPLFFNVSSPLRFLSVEYNRLAVKSFFLNIYNCNINATSIFLQILKRWLDFEEDLKKFRVLKQIYYRFSRTHVNAWRHKHSKSTNKSLSDMISGYQWYNLLRKVSGLKEVLLVSCKGLKCVMLFVMVFQIQFNLMKFIVNPIFCDFFLVQLRL